MITPIHRSDGELIGQLVQNGEGAWHPCTVFGVPIGPSSTREDAEEHLLGHGLSYLAEDWLLAEGREEVKVQIVEASPQAVTIRFVDFGHPDLFGSTRTLETPVEGLLPMR